MLLLSVLINFLNAKQNIFFIFFLMGFFHIAPLGCIYGVAEMVSNFNEIRAT